MARYIIQEASKWYTDERKPKYTIKFKDEEKTLTNKVIVGQNKVKYEFDETINRYDANDSIIDYFIDNDDTLNESKILDPEYISFEMIIKLALNGFDYLIKIIKMKIIIILLGMDIIITIEWVKKKVIYRNIRKQ